jgi:hypothetical protein
MVRGLIKLANHLDENGHEKEANFLDSMIRRLAQEGERPLEGFTYEKLMKLKRELNPATRRQPPTKTRPVETTPPTLRQKQNQLNSSLKALRERQRRFAKDEINPSDLTYTARGFGIASDVADVLADWNESYPNYPMSDRKERLGLGKGTKITWVALALA